MRQSRADATGAKLVGIVDRGIVFRGRRTHVLSIHGGSPVSLPTRAELGTGRGDVLAAYDTRNSRWEFWNLDLGAPMKWLRSDGSERVLALDAKNDRCVVGTRHSMALRRAHDGHSLAHVDLGSAKLDEASFGPGSFIVGKIGGRVVLFDAATLRQIGEVFVLPHGGGALFVASDGRVEIAGDSPAWDRALRCRREGRNLPYQACTSAESHSGLFGQLIGSQ